MPLPAALAARLAKRGIIHGDEVKKEEEVEEVFAEDYDSDDDSDVDTTTKHDPPHHTTEHMHHEEEDMDEDRLIYEKLACPNRLNPYHKCSAFCKNRWGKKHFVHDQSCDKKRERLLRKYPVPEGWEEVGDPDTGRYYYWNVMTDQVSWLPPQHPRAKVVFTEVDVKSKLDAVAAVQHTPRSVERIMEEMEDDIDDLDDIDDPELLLERELEKRASGRHVTDRKKGGRGRNKDLDELDPMDPAAYSDIPRGTWSTGLEIKGSAKTGVDVTASGPLFQQRPYPNPGAVLRANREMEKK